jgi:hypothetical protein
MAVRELWGNVPITTGECLEWKLPGVGFCVNAQIDEWHLVVDRGNSATRPAIARKRAGLIDGEVRRFVTVKEDELSLVPMLPDKPVVIRPDGPIALLPGRRATFSFTVPLWIGFCTGKRAGDTVFYEEPSVLLSYTWFGDIAAGELCYALDTYLRRDPPQEVGMLEALCVIRVVNGSLEKLDFTRLCVHVENLTIYRFQDSLQTNEIHVVYKGPEQSSQITISSEAPERDAQLIRTPRMPESHNIIRKSFDVLRVVTGI